MSTRNRWDTVLVHIGWQADSRSVEPVNTRQKIIAYVAVAAIAITVALILKALT